jgi:transposase
MGKHGKELTIADKQTIISMIEGGMRARKVAEILDRSESTVSRFLKRHQETGNIENKHRTGRPKLITERGARKLSKIVITDRRQSLRDITHEFNAFNVQPCLTRTIQRNLYSLGYNRRSVCKKMVVRKVNRKKGCIGVGRNYIGQ